MIVDNLDIDRSRRPLRPPETDPPLIVDTNRKLSVAITFERFEPIARQCGQISEVRGCIEPVETHLGLTREAREFLDAPSSGEPRGGFVSVADDHGLAELARITSYVNRNLMKFATRRARIWKITRVQQILATADVVKRLEMILELMKAGRQVA